MSTAERIEALETDVAALREQLRDYLRHPVREEVISMRNVYGVRLDAIEARLKGIEFALTQLDSRFDGVDGVLAEILRRLPE